MRNDRAARRRGRTRLLGKQASYAELDRFFDRHEGVDLLERGIAAQP